MARSRSPVLSSNPPIAKQFFETVYPIDCILFWGLWIRSQTGARRLKIAPVTLSGSEGEGSGSRDAEILRYAQDDKTPSCHPERSEGSEAGMRPAYLTYVVLATYGEAPARTGYLSPRQGCHQGPIPSSTSSPAP